MSLEFVAKLRELQAEILKIHKLLEEMDARIKTLESKRSVIVAR